MNKDLLSLSKCCLFEGKSLNEIDCLLSKINYKIKSFKRNEIVFSSNQIADTMGILLSGYANVQKLFPSGKVVIVTRKETSDLIAEPSIFSKAKYYPATVSVCSSCKILFIHKKEVLNLFLLDQTIMSNFLESVSNSMLILKQKIDILSFTGIQEKIAAFLIHEYKNNNSLIVNLPFSKKDWAEYINVSRPSLSRELKILEMNEILYFDKENIQIRNLDKLEQILIK